jgi:hypothetical protein
VGLRCGAKEASDLFGEHFERWAAERKFCVVVDEVLAPYCFESR